MPSYLFIQLPVHPAAHIPYLVESANPTLDFLGFSDLWKQVTPDPKDTAKKVIVVEVTVVIWNQLSQQLF